eukprot:TRINITY_DN4357_c0_g1_i2.p1 TRINITY_DN4357_c0_g1~~TRINITY_DN4357_c0_g1_i2.p1  ORF type:complete len:102 (-),score=20.25 TRINITY_DN4357_c0_g1_i2:122-427(-)
MAVVMRIKFPPTYPLIYKTLRIDSNFTTNQAIEFIGQSLNVPCSGDIGLYLPQEKIWLDPNTPLSAYESLQDAEEVEFKDRKEKGGGAGKEGGGGGCCTIA